MNTLQNAPVDVCPESASTPSNWTPFSSVTPSPIANNASNQAEVNYCTIPIEQDPLAEYNEANISNLTAKPSTPIVAQTKVSSPKVRCKINGYETTCLVDTGANISAIRSDVVKTLGLQIDEQKNITFATAANSLVTTKGSVVVNICFGSLTLPVRCHVVDSLTQPVIFGYDALQQHRAIIDACTSEVRFPSSGSGSSGSGSGSSGTGSPEAQNKDVSGKGYTPCRLTESLNLPGHSHCYVEVTGPANSVCVV